MQRTIDDARISELLCKHELLQGNSITQKPYLQNTLCTCKELDSLAPAVLLAVGVPEPTSLLDIHTNLQADIKRDIQIKISSDTCIPNASATGACDRIYDQNGGTPRMVLGTSHPIAHESTEIYALIMGASLRARDRNVTNTESQPLCGIVRTRTNFFKD